MLSDIDSNTNDVLNLDGVLTRQFEGTTRMCLSISTNYKTIDFSDGWFKMEAQKVKEESQWRVDLTRRE